MYFETLLMLVILNSTLCYGVRIKMLKCNGRSMFCMVHILSAFGFVHGTRH